MKVLKVYGSRGNETVYINDVKTSICEIENAIFFNNKSDFGYGCTNYLAIIEDESELNFFDCSGLKSFNPTRVPYSLYKALSKLPGAGYLIRGDYNEETKTIMVACRV